MTDNFSLESLLSEMTPVQREVFTKEVALAIQNATTNLTLTNLELIITGRCNLACDYCFMRRSKIATDMDISVAKRAVDYFLERAPDNRDLSITFFGGEPLLVLPLMEEIIRYTQEKARPTQQIGYVCTTNGTLIDRDRARLLAELQVPVLFSLDGMKIDHDRHRKFTDGRPTFDRVLESISIMRQFQPWIGARVTVTPETVSRLAESVRWMNENGICQFIIAPALGIDWDDGSLAKFEAQWLDIASYYVETRRKGVLPLRIGEFEESIAELERKHKGSWGCSAGRNQIAVTPDGRFFPCSRFVCLNGGDGAYELGNLDNGIESREMLKDLHDSRGLCRNSCTGCECADACPGTCPAVNHELTGNIYCVNDAECAIHRLNHRLMEDWPSLATVHTEFPLMHSTFKTKHIRSIAQERIMA